MWRLRVVRDERINSRELQLRPSDITTRAPWMAKQPQRQTDRRKYQKIRETRGHRAIWGTARMKLRSKSLRKRGCILRHTAGPHDRHIAEDCTHATLRHSKTEHPFSQEAEPCLQLIENQIRGSPLSRPSGTLSREGRGQKKAAYFYSPRPSRERAARERRERELTKDVAAGS